jgi:hypothetical protein
VPAARQARGQSAAVRQGVLVSYHHILGGGGYSMMHIRGSRIIPKNHYLYINVVG